MQVSRYIQATGKDDHDYANHLYDMERADGVKSNFQSYFYTRLFVTRTEHMERTEIRSYHINLSMEGV